MLIFNFAAPARKPMLKSHKCPPDRKYAIERGKTTNHFTVRRQPSVELCKKFLHNRSFASKWSPKSHWWGPAGTSRKGESGDDVTSNETCSNAIGLAVDTNHVALWHMQIISAVHSDRCPRVYSAFSKSAEGSLFRVVVTFLWRHQSCFLKSVKFFGNIVSWEKITIWQYFIFLSKWRHHHVHHVCWSSSVNARTTHGPWALSS